MRLFFRVALAAALGLTLGGCASKPFDGPTVEAFIGKVTQDGKPVSFPDAETSMKVIHEKGQSFGIPLKQDGSFKIGWMPIGKYSVILNRPPKNGKGPPMMYNVPGGLTIEEGKTEYTIELGKGFKP